MSPEELERLLRRHGVQHIRVGNTDMYGTCPFHDEARPSWGISLTEPHIHGCFSCGAKGTLYTLLRHLGYSRSEALKHGATASRKSNPLSLQKKPVEARIDALPSKEIMYPYSLPPMIAKRFAFYRLISVKTLRQVGCLWDHNDNRLLFPWFDRDVFLGMTGRALNDSPQKIRAYSLVAKGKKFYMPLREIKPGMLIIVEGESDALKVYDAGYQNVVALGFGDFNKALANEIIRSAANRIVLFFDGGTDEPAGARIAARAKYLLERYKAVHIADYSKTTKAYLPKVDPGMLSASEITACIKNSLTFCV